MNFALNTVNTEVTCPPPFVVNVPLGILNVISAIKWAQLPVGMRLMETAAIWP